MRSRINKTFVLQRFSRLFIQLQCFLVGGLVDSSSLSPATHLRSISTQVGLQTVLPCSCKSRLAGVDASACHVQWTNPVDTVFEQQGTLKWQADNFEGRLAVPEDQLGSGDCSLVISDVQIGDAGSYDSFMVVDGEKDKKTRLFIQTVKLLVFDHKSVQSCGPGEDWALELHTRHSVRVIFQGRNSSEWSDLWMRGDANSERLEKHPHKEQLTIKNLRSSDEGLYKVLDRQGLAISTVQLSVAGISKSKQVQQATESQLAAGDAAKSCSVLLIASLLVTSFQIPHL